MGSLFGSAPKASFSTQSTISGEQQDLLKQLDTLLTGSSTLGSKAGDTSLAGLEELAKALPSALTSEQKSTASTATSTLQSLLKGGGIDATEAFKTGVVEPLTDDFNKRVLPGIAGKYGGSAGGVYSSDALKARESAGTDLSRTLSQAGSLYSLGAKELQAKTELGALAATPTISSLLSTIFSGDISNYNAIIDPYQKLLADLIAGGTSSTVQTVGVGTGGSSGLLGGLLGGLASNSSVTSAIGSGISSLFALSDARAKHRLKLVGDVDGIPLYKYEYKGDSTPRLGFLAQDVEKKVPHAVATTPSGMKAVNYSAVLESVLEAT